MRTIEVLLLILSSLPNASLKAALDDELSHLPSAADPTQMGPWLVSCAESKVLAERPSDWFSTPACLRSDGDV